MELEMYYHLSGPYILEPFLMAENEGGDRSKWSYYKVEHDLMNEMQNVVYNTDMSDGYIELKNLPSSYEKNTYYDIWA